MKLKQYLKENGILQKFLVEKIGISANHVNALVHERTKPSIDVAFAIEKITKGQVTLYDWVDKDNFKRY